MTYQQKITFGELRESGVRDVLVYCRDHKCSDHITISADRRPDDVRLSDIEPEFVCTAGAKRGRSFACRQGYWFGAVVGDSAWKSPDFVVVSTAILTFHSFLAL